MWLDFANSAKMKIYQKILLLLSVVGFLNVSAQKDWELVSVNFGSQCDTCKEIARSGVKIAENYFHLEEDIEKVAEIVKTELDEACDRLKQGEKCHKIAAIIAGLVGKMTSEDIEKLVPELCDVAGFCEAIVAVENELSCAACEKVFSEVVKVVQKEINDHETEIGDAADKICDAVKVLPENARETCKIVIKELLQEGETFLPVAPTIVCEEIGACPQ